MTKSLKATVAANDRLLKALITLLTIRDPSLLTELEAIFQHAAAEGNPIGLAMPDVWVEVNDELALIRAMVEEDARLASAATH